MAARRQSLRTVAPGERAKTKTVRAKTITQAAATGTTRELLVALRNRIAAAVQNANTPARDLAALSKRLIEVVHDVEAIDARDEQGATKHADVQDEAFDAAAI